MEMGRKRGSHREREKRESRERKRERERVMVCLHILYFSIFNNFFSVSEKHFIL